jgi:hypothetical protein
LLGLLLLVGLLAHTHDWTGERVLPVTFGLAIESHTAEAAGLTLYYHGWSWISGNPAAWLRVDLADVEANHSAQKGAKSF